MNRLLVLGGVAAIAVAIAAFRPAPAPPAIAAFVPQTPRHARKGHQSRGGPVALVYVVGAVARPGLYEVPADARVRDALVRAGGFSHDADPAAVNLAERVTDGEEIDAVRVGETAPKASRARRPRSRKSRHRAAVPASGASIDLNAADADTLATIPGIGPALAQRIVDYRRINGSFASVDELGDVGGMTQRLVDAVAPYVTVSGTP